MPGPYHFDQSHIIYITYTCTTANLEGCFNWCPYPANNTLTGYILSLHVNLCRLPAATLLCDGKPIQVLAPRAPGAPMGGFGPEAQAQPSPPPSAAQLPLYAPPPPPPLRPPTCTDPALVASTLSSFCAVRSLQDLSLLPDATAQSCCAVTASFLSPPCYDPCRPLAGGAQDIALTWRGICQLPLPPTCPGQSPIATGTTGVTPTPPPQAQAQTVQTSTSQGLGLGGGSFAGGPPQQVQQPQGQIQPQQVPTQVPQNRAATAATFNPFTAGATGPGATGVQPQPQPQGLPQPQPFGTGPPQIQPGSANLQAQALASPGQTAPGQGLPSAQAQGPLVQATSLP